MNNKIVTFVIAFLVFAVYFFVIDYALQGMQGLPLFLSGEGH